MYSASSDTDHLKAGNKSALHSFTFETIKLHKVKRVKAKNL